MMKTEASISYSVPQEEGKQASQSFVHQILFAGPAISESSKQITDQSDLLDRALSQTHTTPPMMLLQQLDNTQHRAELAVTFGLS